MNEINIVENKELREKMAGRIEVLDKVKKLLLLPQLEMMTMQQVADYYKVEQKAVERCYQRNREEIVRDGCMKYHPNEIELDSNILSESKNGRGYREFSFKTGETLRVPNVGALFFSKRAILRIGMLLRDSEVAKEVRTQLLNIVENSSDEVKTKEVDSEMDMVKDIFEAFLNGSKEDMLVSTQKLVQYQRRHIDALSADNKMLAADILKWDDRKSINRAVRVIANQTKKYPGSIWNELYTELYYKHGIGLKHRGESPYIQYVKEDEWSAVQQSLSAICEKYEISPSYVMETAKIQGMESH